MADPKDLIEETREEVVYYLDFSEPTGVELTDTQALPNWKIMKVLADAFGLLDTARAATIDAHSLDDTSGLNLDLWAVFWEMFRMFGWTDDQFKEWIRFEILRRRCSGTPDGLKVVAAAYLTLVEGVESVPWDAAVAVLSIDPHDPYGHVLDDEHKTALDNWIVLTRLEWLFDKPHYIDRDDTDYLGLVVPGDLIELPSWMNDAFGTNDNAGSDPADESYWFDNDADTGFDAGIYDGHNPITDLLEIMWEALPGGFYVDVIIDGFEIADNTEGSQTSDPNVEGYWFIDDTAKGFDAGRMPGAVIESVGVYQNFDLKIHDQPGWKIGRGDRRFIISPEVEYIEAGVLD